MRVPIQILLILLCGCALASAPAYGQAAEAAAKVAAVDEVPEAYRMTSAYPNPFNPQTQFTLTVTEDQQVMVEVYNLLGRRIEVLHDGQLAAGQTYTFSYEAEDVPSGIYLIRVTGEQFVATQRVTLLK